MDIKSYRFVEKGILGKKFYVFGMDLFKFFNNEF